MNQHDLEVILFFLFSPIILVKFIICDIFGFKSEDKKNYVKEYEKKDKKDDKKEYKKEYTKKSEHKLKINTPKVYMPHESGQTIKNYGRSSLNDNVKIYSIDDVLESILE